MNQYLRAALIMTAIFPIAWVIVRLIFKRSIMFKFSISIVGLLFFVSYTSIVIGRVGGTISIILTPINFGVSALVLFYLNRSLSGALMKSIGQLKRLSKGELNQDITRSTRTDELGIITNSVADLSDIFKDVITKIKSNSDNLVQISSQMSAASEQMSVSASEQASSTEEVAATMQNVTANIQQNSKNAETTKTFSNEASDALGDVTQRVEKVVVANNEITENIKIINDISEETNILALNAAVEAARAGEQGKGFAVVASEVRKLAENSKKAADKIMSIANNAHIATDEMHGFMTQTMPKIKQTNELVEDIATSSKEQYQSVQNVDSGIQQITKISQQNAASSEEISSTATQLASQADELEKIVAYFKLA